MSLVAIPSLYIGFSAVSLNLIHTRIGLWTNRLKARLATPTPFHEDADLSVKQLLQVWAKVAPKPGLASWT